VLTLLAATVISCLQLSAVDGDTIKCNGQNMRIMGDGRPFKSGVDAPEIGKAACAKERLLGEQAKTRLSELLQVEGMKVIDSGEHDRFKRPLIWVRLPNGQTAGATLISEGYAVRWKPGSNYSWCD
jgi:micrococcal nuclease